MSFEDAMKGNLDDMMKQAKKMQEGMLDIQKKLEGLLVVGEAGGGSVKVTMNCKMEVKKVEICDAELLHPDEKTVLESLIVAACNAAFKKAEGGAKEEMEAFTKTLGIPKDLLGGGEGGAATAA